MVSGFWQFMGNRLILFRDGLIALIAVPVRPETRLEPASLMKWKSKNTPGLSEKYFPLPPKSAFNFTDKYKRLRQLVWRPCKKEDRKQKNKR